MTIDTKMLEAAIHRSAKDAAGHVKAFTLAVNETTGYFVTKGASLDNAGIMAAVAVSAAEEAAEAAIAHAEKELGIKTPEDVRAKGVASGLAHYLPQILEHLERKRTAAQGAARDIQSGVFRK